MAKKKEMKKAAVTKKKLKKQGLTAKNARRPKQQSTPKSMDYHLPDIDMGKLDAFAGILAAGDTELKKQDLAKRDVNAKYRYYTGNATPEDKEFLTRTGVIDKPETHDIWDLSDRESAMKRLNTGKYQGILGKEGEPISDQQRKADSIALGLSPRARSYKPERVTAKDQYEEAKYRLALKVMSGKATEAEKKMYRKMFDKDDEGGSNYEDRKKKYRELVKDAQDVWNKEQVEKDEFGQPTGKSEYFNEPFRQDARNQMQAAQDSLFWNEKAHIVNQNEGTSLNPQDLEDMFYTGRSVAERVMQEYKNGTLQQRYPVYTEEGLEANLQDIINQEVEKATGGMSLNNIKRLNDELEQQRLNPQK